MERSANDVNILDDACLSVELNLSSEQTVAEESPEMLSSKASDLPLQRKGISSSSELHGRSSFLTTTLQSDHLADTGSGQRTVTEAKSDQSKEPDDCLLLEYQNHLFLLENLNRQTSLKAALTRRQITSRSCKRHDAPHLDWPKSLYTCSLDMAPA